MRPSENPDHAQTMFAPATHWHNCVCLLIGRHIVCGKGRLHPALWACVHFCVCVCVSTHRKGIETEKICVETTRGWDPAVSTEAFPLNCVPLCKRQCQFWTRGWRVEMVWENSSWPRPHSNRRTPCAHIYIAEHTHSVNYTPRNHQRTHTRHRRLWRHSANVFDCTRSSICWRLSRCDANFPTRCLRQDATCWQCYEHPISCSPHAGNLVIISNHNKHSIWEECNNRIRLPPPKKTRLEGHKKKSETCGDPRKKKTKKRVFEVRCWTACVNQNGVITGEGKEWAHRH